VKARDAGVVVVIEGGGRRDHKKIQTSNKSSPLLPSSLNICLSSAKMNSSYFTHLPVYIVLLLVAYLHHAVVDAIEVGDKVCITGYIMDIYCIQLGYLLDNPNITTLEEPENHSFHCLFDESLCYNSGFVVLGEKDSEASLHCLGLRLEESDVVMAAGRAAGSKESSSTHITCKTCSGDASKPVSGYRATVKGTVKDLGDGSSVGVSGQPMLNNIEILDFEVGCGEEDGIIVKNIGGECQILPLSFAAQSEGTQLYPTTTPSDEPSVSVLPTYSPSSSSNPSISSVPSESLDPSSSPSESNTPSVSTQPSNPPTSNEPSREPISSSPDCTKQFCERALSDDYLLRYILNVDDDTITMEAIYDGEAWVAVAFSEDESMPGSDAVM
jgi:hypothetical protein